jgi:hypothetical protein
MMLEAVIQAVILIPVFIFNAWFSVWLYKRRLQRRDTKFLKNLKVEHPDFTLSLISIETSDEAAMDKIKEKIGENDWLLRN